MKTVNLTNGKKAIKVITVTYLHLDRMVNIVTDLIYHDVLTMNSGKKEIMDNVRLHILKQGVSTYNTWYEDTDATPIINELYPLVDTMIRDLFPELINN